MSTEPLWSLGERAASALAPETDLFADQDVAEFNRALTSALRGAAGHPASAAAAAALFASRLVQIPGAALARWLGTEDQPPVELDPKDRRFADPAWRENPAYYSLRLLYEAIGRLSDDLVDAAGTDELTTAKARMASRFLLDAAAPTNFLPTNPAALKRALETGGMSLLRGAGHFVDDVLHN